VIDPPAQSPLPSLIVSLLAQELRSERLTSRVVYQRREQPLVSFHAADEQPRQRPHLTTPDIHV
jgi:hypothetical protein